MSSLARTCLIALGVVATACGTTPPPATDAAPAPITVSVAPAEMKQMRRTFDSGGVVRARVAASIASRITANVERVHVVAGQTVRAGDTLITLDGRDLEANQQRMAAEIAALERTKAAAEADQAAAEASRALAHNMFARTALLRMRDSATGQEADEATSALMAAEAHVEAAAARVAAADASLEAARHASAAADVAESYATIAAPFDGVVTERHVDPGNLATPGAPMLQVDQAGGYRLETDVDESRATVVKVGDGVDVLLGADDRAAPLRGTVAEVARAADAGSHTFRVKIDLPRDASLRSGLFARARFSIGTRAVLAIPAAAVVSQGDLPTIYVVGPDNRAHMRVISTGESNPSWVEVLAGLSAGDQVVVNASGLHDNANVRSAELESRR